MSRPKTIAVLLLAASLCLAGATAAAAADPLVHTVQKGETLYAIARKYDITVDSLMKANGIADAGRLFVGMKLTIPGAQADPPPATISQPAGEKRTIEYVVKKGDTLYGIAKAHGATVDAIVSASGMKSTTIKVGQRLRVPVAVDKAIPTPAAPIAAPEAAATSSPVAASKTWPAAGSVSYLQGKLKGVSIAAEPSSTLLAIRAGTVISAGPFRGFGLVAFVQSTDGLVYVYGGAGALSVRVGDGVRKGSAIGKVSSERDAAAYFFVFKGADTIDPNSAPRD
ncbi:MAG: hypothetical protein CVV47_13855 [Spirochaetae bacterium HGW-Spirochaetae-3]|jgi:LysM repeat protein|nr:MAG: hypothetical protein CVV47_13855 [Spirochaetae bacterium HGW-Spirochaetae-3]